MLSLLIVAVAFSLVMSFVCSLAEAAIFAVPLAHVKHLAESGSRRGAALLRLKEDIEKPITAVLIINTIANTGGATLAGAVAGELWGDLGVVAFSLVFALTMLYIAEVAPKFIGVVYARSLAPWVAVPLSTAVRFFSPLISVSGYLSRRLERGNAPKVSQEEVLSLAALGTEEGALDRLEGSVISNVIGLDRVLVKDVLTPRVSVFRCSEELTLGEVEKDITAWDHTRVPLHSKSDPDHLISYVRQRDIYRQLVRGRRDLRLRDVAQALTTVPELAPVDKILMNMLESREHMFAVADEHGSLAGIITLEDIIEEIVGHEILDEYDTGPS